MDGRSENYLWTDDARAGIIYCAGFDIAKGFAEIFYFNCNIHYWKNILASAGMPDLSSKPGLGNSILTAKTSLVLSSLVWIFFGVNSASGEI